jgi:MYXO-CTERM domain-containing protein
MDFIETLFGIAPDGGDGSLEWLLLLIPLVGVAMIAAWRRRRARQAASRR